MRLFKQFSEFYKKLTKNYNRGESRFTFPLLHYFFTFIAVLLVFYIYLASSQLWIVYGGVVLSKKALWLFEIPFFIIVYFILTSPNPSLKNTLKSFTFASIALLLPYVGMDIFYPYQNRSVMLSDFQDLYMLLDVDFLYFASLIGSLLVLFFVIFLALYTGSSHMQGKKKWGNIFLRASLLLVLLANFDYIFSIQKHKIHFVKFNEKFNIRDRGRYATVIHYSDKAKEELVKIKNLSSQGQSKDVSKCKNLFGNIPQESANIHIIVLESFIDVQAISNITFSQSPLHPKLKNMFKERDSLFDFVISPVAGGNTSQSEFEILSGLPALKKLGRADFYGLNGHAVNALPNLFRASGYETVASIATEPVYYNSVNAYKSLGFSQLFFDDGKSYIKRDKADKWIYDGDLLQQNFQYIYMKIIYKKEKESSIMSWVPLAIYLFPETKRLVPIFCKPNWTMSRSRILTI